MHVLQLNQKEHYMIPVDYDCKQNMYIQVLSFNHIQCSAQSTCWSRLYNVRWKGPDCL